MKKKVLAMIALVALLISAFPISAAAASYPTVYISYTESTPVVPYGEVGTLIFTVFPEFKNEKLQVRVYDQYSSLVASSETGLYNSSAWYRTVTLSCDTAKLEMTPGKYKVEYWMEFYSLYQWNTAPNKYSYTIEVVNNVCKGNHNFVKDRVVTEATCEEDGEVIYKCSRCKYQQLKTVTGKHSYTSNVTMPTLTSNGYTTFTCSTCGDSYIENYTFPDVRNNAWYYDAVEFVAAKGYMTGYQNGRFGPADNLQRQDFVVTLARIAGADLTPYRNSTGSLADVAKGSYYAPAVAWAVDQGIITGYQNGKFGVGHTITREQVCTILYRYIGSPAMSNVSETLNAYPDARNVSAFAKDAMAWAIQNGVISGMQNGKLAPVSGASRAQIATIIMRMDQNGMF